MHVVAGVIYNRHRDQVLVAKRLPGSHLGGYWEFPGGKLQPGEEPLAALVRELREELNIEVKTAEPLIKTDHDYPEKSVTLDVWSVYEWTGVCQGKEGQVIRWLDIDALDPGQFPAADQPVIKAVRFAPL